MYRGLGMSITLATAFLAIVCGGTLGQICDVDDSWCSDDTEGAYNNMHEGTFGVMFEAQEEGPLCVCGFRFEIGSGSGITGSLDCTPGMPCRAILYAVNDDDSVEELAYQVLTTEISGATDFFFDQITSGYRESERYAIVIETEDSEWELWQLWGEESCPYSQDVRIENGYAYYSQGGGPPGYDDYDFLLWVTDDLEECPIIPGVIPNHNLTWGAIKSIYR